MTAAALLPVVVLVGALVLFRQGAWPTSLASNLAVITMIGFATVALMDRLSARRT